MNACRAAAGAPGVVGSSGALQRPVEDLRPHRRQRERQRQRHAPRSRAGRAAYSLEFPAVRACCARSAALRSLTSCTSPSGTAAPCHVGPRRARAPVSQLRPSTCSAAPEARLLHGCGEVVFAAHCDSDAIAAHCASSHKPARRSGSRCTLHECRQARRLRRCLNDRVCCCPCCAVRAALAACGRAPRDAGRLCNAGCYWLVAS